MPMMLSVVRVPGEHEGRGNWVQFCWVWTGPEGGQSISKNVVSCKDACGFEKKQVGRRN